MLLQPFNEVIKWARIASKQAAYPYGGDAEYLKSPMALSAQSLLREGERALRRLSPLIENPSSHLSQHLRNLMMKNGKFRRTSNEIDPWGMGAIIAFSVSTPALD